jgi:hypothetical protein
LKSGKKGERDVRVKIQASKKDPMKRNRGYGSVREVGELVL